MNRRHFVNSLAGLLTTATLDPERLLWKPTKTIFIPPPSRNLLLEVDKVTKDMLYMQLYRFGVIEGSSNYVYS